MSFSEKLKETALKEGLKQVIGAVVTAALAIVGTAVAQRKAHILTSASEICDLLTANSIPLWLFIAVFVPSLFTERLIREQRAFKTADGELPVA